MGRAPCCSKVGLHRGPWTPREDTLLKKYIEVHGEGQWRSLPKRAGLLRCGKSCRLRWMNYLRPDIKRGNITPDEDDLIIRMHSLLGNRWSLIAGRLPGRTDNEIKNYWNTHLSKKLRSQGTDPNTHKKLPAEAVRLESSKKRSKSNNNNNRKQKNKTKPNLVGPTRTIVHLPKPVKLKCLSLPRNDSLESFNVTTGSSSSQGEQDHYVEQVVNLPWSDHGNYNEGENDNNNGYGLFLVGVEDNHNHLVNGSDTECRSSLPTADGTLEKLYEEYLQLLKTEENQDELNSFAESLLV